MLSNIHRKLLESNTANLFILITQLEESGHTKQQSVWLKSQKYYTFFQAGDILTNLKGNTSPATQVYWPHNLKLYLLPAQSLLTTVTCLGNDSHLPWDLLEERIPSINSCRVIFPSWSLSILLKKSITRDFLWFIHRMYFLRQISKSKLANSLS